MASPQPGSILAGKYLVEHVLGEGGMGVVVAAKHLELEQRVAIKFLLPDALQVPEVVERFAREARAAAKIKGEHVARIIDVGRFDDGSPFMVLEYLEGHDLAAILRQQGPLQVEDAVRYLLETCEALAEAHVARIVHRDLKPSNLFLARQPDRRSIIKVLDFGISKVVEPTNSALTKTTSVMGTAHYMSPEQLIAPKSVDQRSDIWSLGVILFELVTGRPPFVGESVPEIIAQILQNQPAPPSSFRPDLPRGLEQVIARCMRSKMEERFNTVAELAAALSPWAAGADRLSVASIAHVFGLSHPPPGMESPPTAHTMQLGVPPGGFTAHTMAAQNGPGTEGVPAQATPLTTHGIAAATIHSVLPPRAKSSLPLILGGVIALAGVAGGALLLRRAQQGTVTVTPGVLATPTTTQTTGPVATAGGPATPNTIAPGEHDPEGTQALKPLTSQTAGPANPGAGTAGGRTQPNGGARVGSRVPGHASASTSPPVTSPPAVPTTPPAEAVTAAAPTSKNPLQIRIK